MDIHEEISQRWNEGFFLRWGGEGSLTTESKFASVEIIAVSDKYNLTKTPFRERERRNRGIQAKTRPDFQIKSKSVLSPLKTELGRNHQELVRVTCEEYKGKKQNRKWPRVQLEKKS